MKTKLKKIVISFILMFVVNLIFSLDIFWDFGINSPYVGLLYVLGLLFGPYGAMGAVLANIFFDFMAGFTPIEILPSAIFSFGISYLAYKLWYSGFKTDKVTEPSLDNLYHLCLFLVTIIICAFIYSIAHANLLGIFISADSTVLFFSMYFFNFINFAFVFGIIGIFLSRRFDLFELPRKSNKEVNRKAYNILFLLMMIVAILLSLSIGFDIDKNIVIAEVISLGILLFAYLTKPFEYDLESSLKNTVVGKIIRQFLTITLLIAVFGIIISFLGHGFVNELGNQNVLLFLIPGFIITDTIIVIFFIPCIILIKYIQNKVISPISEFSEINQFIKENEKIEAKDLVEVYSNYIHENTEIGTLARSYIDLIEYNNNYIENIRNIEGERNRVEAELNIATKIQASALPTDAIKTDEFIVDGYSQPAKEVGGDFFDYYMLDDENLAIVIGDASGKGVPAALLAMITQVGIKQILKHNHNPSEVLFLLNNQLCENNTEFMFITLWLGIYNKSNNKLVFSNAGHNPPLIKDNAEFKYLTIDSGVVLGLMEDYEYINEELTLDNGLVLYTDGITDANNNDGDMYGEDRLLKFFKGFNSKDEPIVPLLNDISSFTDGADQFDDMTLLYLRIND